VIDGIIYIIGAATAVVGLLGILAGVTLWSTDRVIKLLKVEKEIIAWYVDKARKERDAKRIPG
jgi:xanthosine utilization system XapX-like protein